MEKDNVATTIRKKYKSASMECIQNIKNVEWIYKNYQSLTPGDLALVMEYGPTFEIQKNAFNQLTNFYIKK